MASSIAQRSIAQWSPPLGLEYSSCVVAYVSVRHTPATFTKYIHSLAFIGAVRRRGSGRVLLSRLIEDQKGKMPSLVKLRCMSMLRTLSGFSFTSLLGLYKSSAARSTMARWGMMESKWILIFRFSCDFPTKRFSKHNFQSARRAAAPPIPPFFPPKISKIVTEPFCGLLAALANYYCEVDGRAYFFRRRTMPPPLGAP